MYLGKPLFYDGSLNSFLQQRLASLRGVVETRIMHQPDIADSELVAEVLEQMSLEPLNIDFTGVTKDVQPVKLRIRDYGRDIEIDGVRATRTYPFTGDEVLFRLTPSSFSSVLPHGAVSRSSVTVGIEGRNDLESLKRDLEQLEKTLREYASWQRPDIEQFNASLKAKIEHLAEAKRKHLGDIARLRDAL